MNNRVFITGGNEGYLPLIEVLFKSIKPHLEDIDFIVYTFNCDYDIEGCETRRINLPNFHFPKQTQYYNLAWKDNTLYWAKYYATLDAFKDYEFVSWLDGDAFVTEHINTIWTSSEECKNSPQPLFMSYFHGDIHTWKKGYGGVNIEGSYGAEGAFIFKTPRNPNKKILAAGIYLAHKSHIKFFTDVLDMWYQSHHEDCPVFVDDNAYSEERLANVYTWKRNIQGWLPITWINYFNEHKEDFFKDKKLTSYINKGADVMYHTPSKLPLMIHGAKSSEELNNLYLSYNQTPNKLMIVAHPDDELIFGGTALIDEKNWRVICLTNKLNKIRRKEFEKSMKDLQIPEFKIYDLKDNINSSLDNFKLTEILTQELNSQNWDKIVTHNNVGEYGHPHHKQLHDKVKELVEIEKLWVFGKDINYNNPKTIKHKNQIFNSTYHSQKEIYSQIKEMRGRWFKDKDMTCNYIDHGVITPYLESIYKDDIFIHCFDK